jgi:hypothetical protein
MATIFWASATALRSASAASLWPLRVVQPNAEHTTVFGEFDALGFKHRPNYRQIFRRFAGRSIPGLNSLN